MPSLGCWCLAPESTLRHLWRSQNLRRRSVGGSGMEFTVLCSRVLSSTVQGRACGARAAAMLAHTVSLGVGMLRGFLERAKLLFAIVDLMSVNGTAFRQLRVACEVRNPHRSFSWRNSNKTPKAPPFGGFIRADDRRQPTRR
eukprot:scaffold17350_cov103-Isochrysis_galbana.AAC.1